MQQFPIEALRTTRRRLLIQSAAAALTVNAALAGQPSGNKERVEGDLGAKLDAQLQRFADYGFSGSLLVVSKGKPILVKGYGFADVERRIPNRADTRFEMNSITKSFTGVAILQLAAAGKIDLDAPVETYLGEFPAEKRGATIAQLANHTSGLIVRGTDLASETRDAFVSDIKRSPRESAPGDTYRYTNAGFSLLAAIIETASGEKYEEYLKKHLFAPAGMSTATFRDELPLNDPHFAHGYVGTPAALEPGPENPYGWGTIGAGGVWSTVGDMHKWLVAIERGNVLTSDMRATLYAEPVPPAEEAFGWRVDKDENGRRLIHKGGGSDDFASQLYYYPSQDAAVIWASNNLRQRWRRMLNHFVPRMLFGGGPADLPAVHPQPFSELEARAGTYIALGAPVEVRAAKDYIYVLKNDAGIPSDLMYFPQSADAYTGFDVMRVPYPKDPVVSLRFTGADAFTVKSGPALIDARRSPFPRDG